MWVHAPQKSSYRRLSSIYPLSNGTTRLSLTGIASSCRKAGVSCEQLRLHHLCKAWLPFCLAIVIHRTIVSFRPFRKSLTHLEKRPWITSLDGSISVLCSWHKTKSHICLHRQSFTYGIVESGRYWRPKKIKLECFKFGCFVLYQNICPKTAILCKKSIFQCKFSVNWPKAKKADKPKKWTIRIFWEIGVFILNFCPTGTC
jgi:hypothetical protein